MTHTTSLAKQFCSFRKTLRKKVRTVLCLFLDFTVLIKSYTVDDILLLHNLKSRFLERIQQEWPQKFSDFGPSYDTVASKNAFLLALQEQIESKISHKMGLDSATDYLVSVDFLGRFVYGETKRLQSKKRDTLAMYLDWENWEAFVAARPIAEITLTVSPPAPDVTPSVSTDDAPNKKRIGWMGAALLAVCVIALLTWLSSSSKRHYEAARFSIAKREGIGVPTTMVFQYDLNNTPFDSAFVEVMGSIGGKTRMAITEKVGIVPATFTSSGIKKAKLEIDGKIIKELSFPIYTNGWGGRIITPNRWYPYQRQSQIRDEGTLYISPNILETPSEHQHFEAHFSNCTDFGIAGDSSVLEVRVRNNSLDGGLGCHDIGWSLLDSLGQGYEIHLLDKSCTTFAQLRINDREYVATKDFDLLSKLGQNVTEWGIIKFELKSHRLRIFFNDTPILAIPYEGKIERVKHLSCKFMGSGRVDWVKLKNSHSGQVAYFENFNVK
jgi:hypothetical protein